MPSAAPFGAQPAAAPLAPAAAAAAPLPAVTLPAMPPGDAFPAATAPLDGPAWRAHFPVCDDLAYLDHASLGPTPCLTAQAAAATLAEQGRRGSLAHAGLHEIADATRAEFAAFIGAPNDRVAHAANASAAISLIAAGLPWQQGDEVVVPAIDFPSVVLPWMTLQARGVRVHAVPCADGRVDVDALLAACGAATRVMCVSWVQFSSGCRLDLARLGAACRQRGILLVVDGVQGVGAVQMNVADLPIDALVVHAYKWMLAPQGVAWLYVGDRLAEQLSLTAAGPRSLTPRDSYFDHRYEPRAGAARFETGILGFHGIAAARASLALLRAAGPARVEAAVLRHAEHLARGLLDAGCHVQGGADRRDFASGIVVFRHPHYDAATCRQMLLRAGVVTAAREGHVRVAAHFYNTDAEIETLLRTVRDMKG
ncbi:aminotransferase class V-fold PLP-dependent enzyme [Bordetella sp. LUAb4]|uniref:aminotransferase class V-fold PLP-dependent enzyme n=1 Tax=Bordetella sp. LUAb4 TaxID=2843195 RepID=UPI001E43CA0C|nr:aminotransferase class V-fold PLP-dependent enzyme [Bordetella sp. LUAb4]